jgi:hypothetical protein
VDCSDDGDDDDRRWKAAEPMWLTTIGGAHHNGVMPVNGIGLEEHVAFPDMLAKLPASVRNEQHAVGAWIPGVHARLAEVGEARLAAMDQSCTRMQVLSVVMSGAEKFHGLKALTFAREYNDRVHQAIQRSPAPCRFRAFAHLPMSEPPLAAIELVRCVTALGCVGALINGMSNGLFLDSPEFAPLLSAAEMLDVPLYLHPAPPPAAVRDTYLYTTEYLSPEAATMLATSGWSWHAEVGLHLLRLCFARTFDRHPRLKIIVGHQGEMVPMMMRRADGLAQWMTQPPMPRPISDMLRQHVWVTISGMFTLPPLQCAIATFGAEHVCWSVDYPFHPEAVEQAPSFIKSMRDTMSAEAVNAILHGNARRLLKI